MKRIISICLCAFALFMMVQPATAKNENVPNVIFDTDMGNDVDDVMALDMLLKYHDEGKINLMGIMNNRQAPSAVAYIDLYTSWCGHSKMPIGDVVNGTNPTPEKNSYAYKTWNKKEDGKLIFQTKRNPAKHVKGAVELYRELLSKADDGSVIIISVGFSTNLAQLMATGPDKHSILSGVELLKQKVKYFSIMAGNFVKQDYREYNVINDIPAAKELFENPPVPIVFTDFVLGKRVLYPGSSVENDFGWVKYHPYAEAYKVYLEMPYDRPTWDPIAALYVLEQDSDFFSLSEAGTVKVTPKGCTEFTPKADGKCRYLICTDEQCRKIRDHFVKVITKRPKGCKAK